MTDDHSFEPTATWDALRARAALLKKLRTFFDEHDFLEVTTPVLSADTVVDLHLDPFQVTRFSDPCQPTVGPTWFLQTSPEFHMKRLLAAGAQAIYQIGPAFRAAESGPIHNIEFTMVEWYRVGDDMAAGMQFLADVACALFQTPSPDRVSYADAFGQHVGLNPHTASTTELKAAGANLRPAIEQDTREEATNFLWSHFVESKLGLARPVLIYDYPADQAALAKIRQDPTPVAERFELYFRGIELANGYHELTDAEELKSRIIEINRNRVAAGKPVLPGNSRLLHAMESGIPPSVGVALGFDRSVMIATDSAKLRDVQAFPENVA